MNIHCIHHSQTGLSKTGRLVQRHYYFYPTNFKKIQISGDKIAGIGLSGQMHSSVFLDKHSEIIRRAILWCDTRTKTECEWIMNKVGRKKIASLVANPALEGFTARKYYGSEIMNQKIIVELKKFYYQKIISDTD